MKFTSLSEICIFLTGLPGSKRKASQESGEPAVVLGPRDYDDADQYIGDLMQDSQTTVNLGAQDFPKYHLRKGDVLFQVIGSRLRSCLPPPDVASRDYVAGAYFMILRPKPAYSDAQHFVFRALNSRALQGQLIRVASATSGALRVRKSHVSSLKIAAPALLRVQQISACSETLVALHHERVRMQELELRLLDAAFETRER